ncbi:adenylate/guanylate cyclase domain-containing protein [Bradyrhizobium sp. LA6.1]|uniref:adenylate/guanylate cyclase domain-containing protein n=1 Tax=Bradyrhizobium sp. LA6.1 TaxID=3156378 RepID=UPI00339A8435
MKETFADSWEESNGHVVPDPEDLLLSNEARHFERATILYADLTGSTDLVQNYPWSFAGEIYKSYLACAARIVRKRGGEITSYDGDRIMAVFIGDNQRTDAAKCGLQINWAVKNIVNPAMKAQYPNSSYTVGQVVGIDTSEVRKARIGVRGGNDLVWIGRAANHAAKLTECRKDYPTWLTAEAYARLSNSSKYGGSENELMWKEFNWTTMGDRKAYGSKLGVDGRRLKGGGLVLIVAPIDCRLAAS